MLRIPYCHHRFTLRGLNLERFIQQLHGQGIPLVSIRRTDARTLLCECRSCDLAAITALAEEKGWRLLHPHPIRLSAFFSLLKSRPGLLIGCVLCLLLTSVLSQFIWRVDIRHAGPYQAEVRSFLTESGCRPGMLRSAVDAAAIERQLTFRYPDVAWFHVHASGMTLVVEVTHGARMPDLPSAEPADLIATRSGVVEAVRVYAGTALVSAGDAVRKGQVLIRGEERRADGTAESVRARGEVIARCWHTETAQLPLYEIHSSETGRMQVQTRIHTPWRSMPQQWTEPDYLAYNACLETFPLGGAFFPVSLQRMTFSECAMEYVRRDEAEVRREALEAASELLKNRLRNDEIIDKWADYCMIEGDTLAASVTAEWLMDIGGISSP